MNKAEERGFALPIVMVVLMLLVFISFFLLSHIVRHHQSTTLVHETITAQYVAESGIAMMQQRLKNDPELDHDFFYQWKHYYVRTKLMKRGATIELESQAVGKNGVRQTVRVKLDPHTLAIREMLK